MPIFYTSARAYLMLFSFILLLSVRLFSLKEIPLHDYDAVRSFEIASAIAGGDFTSVFNHGSPSYHLLNAFLFFWVGDKFALLVLGSIFNVLGVLLFSFFCAKKWQISVLGQFVISLFLGTSSLLVYLGRCVTNENLNFFLFSLFVYQLLSNGEILKKRHQLAFIFALAMSVNYKFLLLLPFFLSYLFFEKLKKEDFLGGSNLFFVIFSEIKILLSICKSFLMAFLGLVIFYSLLGFCLGLPISLYAKNFLGIFLGKTQAAHSPILQTDFFFYFYYFFDFENYLLLLSALLLLLSLFFKSREKHFSRAFFLLIFVLCGYFLMLCLLPKAPRILLFLLPFLFISPIYFLEKRTSNKFFYLLFLLLLPFSFIRLHERIFLYAEKANFIAVNDYLQKHKITDVYTFNSLQILPFLSSTKVKKLPPQATAPSNVYVFWDNYHLALHETPLALPAEQAVLVVGYQKLYLSPFLFYEHAEYTGLSYQKTTQLWKKAIKEHGKWALVKY